MQLPSFETLRYMAENNPQELEALRQSLISNAIDSAPAEFQRRLRGLQFRIDAERQIASNPISACLRLSRMMNDQLQSMLNTINTPETHNHPPQSSASATILRFPFLAHS